jgi:hypothetical protein
VMTGIPVPVPALPGRPGPPPPGNLTCYEWAGGAPGAAAWSYVRSFPSAEVATVTLLYEIRVTGTLPPEALADFEGLTVSEEPVETVLHGPMPDQAALHGLLARLELFGVQVVEIRRLQRPAPGDG